MDTEKISEQIKEYIENNPGYIKYNKMHLIKLSEDYAQMSVDLDENSLNPNHTAHGGLIFGLADSVMGLAARMTNRNVVTLSSNINYLKPGQGSKLIGEAEKIKVGKTTAVFKCNIYDEKNNLIAIATGTYYFID